MTIGQHLNIKQPQLFSYLLNINVNNKFSLFFFIFNKLNQNSCLLFSSLDQAATEKLSTLNVELRD